MSQLQNLIMLAYFVVLTSILTSAILSNSSNSSDLSNSSYFKAFGNDLSINGHSRIHEMSNYAQMNVVFHIKFTSTNPFMDSDIQKTPLQQLYTLQMLPPP